jgi:hypothetical protein
MPMRPEMTMQQDSAPHRMLEGVSGYVAGFDALVLGAQLDAGPMLGVKSLHLVPEFALGLIGDKSVLLAVGGEYRFPMLRLKGNTSLTPHARLSLGLLAASGDTDSEFGFNVAYGVTFVPTNPLVAIGRPRFFVEHQGLNFFSHNRLAGGMRWQF